MTLVLGDIHGNFSKAKAFLAFRPEEKHVFVGDYVDSFAESDEQVLYTLKLCIESDAILLLGNHDLHYFSEKPFLCSGHRGWMQKGLNEIFEAFVDRFSSCAVFDGFIITHGGVSRGLGLTMLKTIDVNEIKDKLDAEWKDYLATRFQRKHGAPRIQRKIFNIGVARGGMDGFSGIFWADYRSEPFYGVPQVFGHSKTQKHDIINIGKKTDFFALSCDNDRRICLNTSTKEVESFE